MEETVDELFPTAPAAVWAILGELRRMVRDTPPDATEIFYHGAGCAGIGRRARSITL